MTGTWQALLFWVVWSFSGSAFAAPPADSGNVRKPNEQWAVVALTRSGEDEAATLRAVHLLEAGIRTYPTWSHQDGEYKFPLIEHESLSALYVSRYTRGPTPLSDEALAELPRLLEEALSDVAHERFAKARGQLEKIQERTGRALETVNRDQRLATQVLDACLYDVRIELKMAGRQAAIIRALKCRQDVPDAAPSEDTHPEEVLSVLRQAEQTLSVSPKSTLSIDSTPRQGCDVYLSGKYTGKTPYLIRDATQRRYLVQVECEKGVRGRVHEIDLKEAPVQMTIDTDFESVLHTDDSGIRLTYPRAIPQFIRPRRAQWRGPDPSAPVAVVVRDTPEGSFHERLYEHIVQLRAQLGVTHLVVVHTAEPSEVQIDVFGPRRRDGDLPALQSNLPREGFGEPRKACDAGAERWPWTHVMIWSWTSNHDLGVFSWVEEQRRKREREDCEKGYARQGAALRAPASAVGGNQP